MLAVETGADAVGMIFAPSVRRITEGAAKHIAEQLPPFITPVGVFVNPSRDDIARARSIFPDLVIQLHGNESPSFVSSIDGRVIKARAQRKAAARKTYEGAIEKGKTTVLHEEVLRGVHMLSVGHIPPGKEVEVSGRLLSRGGIKALSIERIEGGAPPAGVDAQR